VRGAAVTPQAAYALGKDWYATRLDFDWERPGAAQVEAAFARHGLTGPFWALPTEVG
jgi:hypothetical protein